MSIIEFTSKYHDYKMHCKQQETFNDGHPLHQQMLQDLTERYKAKFPRRKFILEKVQKDLTEYEAVYTSYRDRATKIYDEWFTEKMRLEYDLSVIAEVITPKELQEHSAAQSDYDIVHVVSSASYRTQGYGAAKYAKGEAIRWQQKFENSGISTRLEEEVSSARFVHGIRSCKYILLARCAPIVAEIIRRKPEVPLREWLKMCWKQGVNPRVYNPFLRYGLEEELNLDYFGNDVDPERKAVV